MIGVGIAAFLLVMAVAYLATKPFLVGELDGRPGGEQLREDRSRALAQIRDLDMEFETGKLAEDEYRSQRARRLAQARQAEGLLAELVADGGPTAYRTDGLGGATDAGDGEDVERRIAARKRALERTR